MKKRETKKLVLSKGTLCNLTDPQMRQVAGGEPLTATSCLDFTTCCDPI